MTDAAAQAADAFIAKWKGTAASELSTSQSFLIELCELLGVERPHATAEQDYMFERPLTFHHADGSKSPGRVDLYRRGAFVLESKKLKVGAHTRGPWKKRLPQIVDTLEALGRVRRDVSGILVV